MHDSSQTLQPMSAIVEVPGGSDRSGLFVGRTVELSRVRELIAQLSQGRAGGLFVMGEAGVGKTRLLAEARTIAEDRGLRTASVACLPMTAALPFDPVVELLRLLGVSVGRQLTGDSPRELFGFVVDRLEQVAASEPLLLCLDDLQWSDAATFDVVRYCLARLSDLPLGWLLSARSGVSASGLAHRLGRDGSAQRVELPPLSVGETEQLVEARLGRSRVDENLVRAVHQRTGGNPFLCVQLLRVVSELGGGSTAGVEASVQAIVPTGVRDEIEDRAGDLPKTLQTALDWAAMLPEPFTFEELEAVGGPDLGDAPDQLAQAGFLTRDEKGGWGFVHSIVRDAIYKRLSERERCDRHAAIADALARGPLERLAPQLVAARRWGAAAQSYLELGRLALNRRQGEDAAQLYARAAELAAQAEEKELGRHAQAGQVLARVQSGDVEQAGSEADRLRAALRTDGESDERLGFLTRYARALFDHSMDIASAREVLSEAGPLIDGAEGAVLASVLTVRASVLYWAGEAELALSDAERAVELAMDTNDGALQAESLNALGRIVGNVRSPPDGITILERALELARQADLVEEIATARTNLGVFAWATNDIASMEAHARAGLELEGLSWRGTALIHTNLGFANAARGDLDGSLAHMLTALRYGQRAGPHVEALVTISVVYLHLARWELPAARRLLEALPAGIDEIRLADVWGLLLEQEGSPAAALAWFQKGTPADRRASDSCLVGVARSAAAIDDLTTAREADARLAVMVEHWPGGRWKSHEAHGWIALVEGRTDDAAAAFHEAAGLCPEAPDAARLRLEAARLRRDRAEIMAAIEAFEKMGAAREADRARAVARQLGMRPGRRHRHQGELTAREQEVAQLIAAGHTNAEIAAMLYLSPRTVERHVGNILTKLNCRSRVQVAAQAATGQLPGTPATLGVAEPPVK